MASVFLKGLFIFIDKWKSISVIDSNFDREKFIKNKKTVMLTFKKDFFLKVKFILLFYLQIVFCQEIPNEFQSFSAYEILLDAGRNWTTNTSFGPVRFQDLQLNNKFVEDTTSINTRYGFYSNNNHIAQYSFGHIQLPNYFYIYLYSRIVGSSDNFERYTGLPRKKSRMGFNSGETDLSGIGYDNDKFLIQLGRGRQSWGAGNMANLTLDENSPPYEYLLSGINLGKFKFRSFNGFLESDSIGFNRYIFERTGI